MHLRAFGLAVAALFVCAAASAQEGGLRADIVTVQEVDFPNARAILNIEDASGEPASSLRQSDFSVTIDGKPASVLSAELATSQHTPLDVLFVFDTSGSLVGVPIESAKVAGKALLAELSPSDRVAIMTFSDEVTLLQDYTDDRALVAGAIDALAAVGNTAFYQATFEAARSMATSPAPRKAVVLLSDGAEFGNKSRVTREEALYAAQASHVPFFIVAYGNEVDRPYLQELASVTEGRLFETPRIEDLASIYAAVGRLLRSQYVVTFDATAAAGLPEATVSVTVRVGDREATGVAPYRPGTTFAPQVSVAGLTEGEQLSERRKIRLSIVPAAQVSQVSWYIDDVNVYASAPPEHAFTFDPAQYAAGEHALRVVVQVGGREFVSGVAFSSTPPAAAPGGGLHLLPIISVAGVLAVLAASGFLLVRARLARGEPIGPIRADTRITPLMRMGLMRHEATEPGEATAVAESIGEPKGRLISRAGPDAGIEYLVGVSPVCIGWGPRCGVRVLDEDLASEEARIWVRNGHLMLHRLTRLSVIANEGVSGGWTILQPGDTFDIGTHRFEFRLLDDGPAISAAVSTPGAQGALSTEGPRTDQLDASASLRLLELMPRDAGGFPSQDARAS